MKGKSHPAKSERGIILWIKISTGALPRKGLGKAGDETRISLGVCWKERWELLQHAKIINKNNCGSGLAVLVRKRRLRPRSAFASGRDGR